MKTVATERRGTRTAGPRPVLFGFPGQPPGPRKNARLKTHNFILLNKTISIFRAFMRGF
jgi:hypothetical protein